MRFLLKYIFDTILYKVQINGLYQNLDAVYQNGKNSLQFVWKQFFVFHEHCAFCLREVLMRCKRYGNLHIGMIEHMAPLHNYQLTVVSSFLPPISVYGWQSGQPNVCDPALHIMDFL